MNEQQFFVQMGRDLGIHAIDHEVDSQFVKRVALSAASCWMLTAIRGGDDQVSIIRVKDAAKSRLDAFSKIHSALSNLDVGVVTEYLFTVHLENGSFYHTPSWTRPVKHQLIGQAGCSFVRGMSPEEPVAFSGPAAYSHASAELTDLSRSFDLPAQSPCEILAMLWQRGMSQSFINDGSYETLHGERVGKRISRAVLRRPHEGAGYDFFLLDGQSFCRIPAEGNLHDLVGYAQLAMLSARAKVLIRSHVVSISFDNRLPKSDLRFLRYGSWPDDLCAPWRPWRFTLASDLWPIYRERLKFLGYTVEESYE